MSKEQLKDLTAFLAPFGEELTELVLWLRAFVWDQYPQANELIYDNYNALAFGWSPTEKVGHTFCSIAVGRTSKNVHFGFYWGSQIADPEGLLIGNGNQYRYILVKNKKEFPKAYIKKLVKEAWINSLAKVKDEKQITSGKTIVKSISPAKREKAPATKKSNRTGVKNTDTYIAGFPESIQEKLNEIRAAIKKAAPEAVEKISYMMPAFNLHGDLVYFAAFKNHIGLYPTSSGVEHSKEKLTAYKTSRGAIQFPLNKPLPLALVSKIVKFRVKENLAKAKKK